MTATAPHPQLTGQMTASAPHPQLTGQITATAPHPQLTGEVIAGASHPQLTGCCGYYLHTILAGSYSGTNCYLGTVEASTSQTYEQNIHDVTHSNKYLDAWLSKHL